MIYNTVQMFEVGKIFINQSLVSYARQRLHLFDQMKQASVKMLPIAVYFTGFVIQHSV